MIELLVLTLPYPPAGTTGNHAVKHARGGHYMTAKAKAYRSSIAVRLAVENARRQLEGPIAVEWYFSPPDRRARDLDNVRKTLADALTHGGLWIDDSNRVIVRESFVWMDPVEGGKVVLKILAEAM